VTSGYNLGCRSEFLSRPCLFPAWSTWDREKRGDWKPRAALLRSPGQDPSPQPRLLEKQRRRWGRKGVGRWRKGGRRRGKGGRAEPTTRRPDSDVDRRCCGPSARRRGLGSSPPAAHARGAQAVRRHWEGPLPLGSRARALSCGGGGAGRGAGLRRGGGGEAVSGAGDDDAEAVAAQGGAMVMPTSDATTATVEDSPPAACGRRRRRGSEGSTTHPRRALPPAEIDLPEGGATVAEAAAARLGSKT
jgi:hypothetical protein